METWFYVSKVGSDDRGVAAKFGPFFSRSELDQALREAGLSAGRGYALIRETGRSAWVARDFDCEACGHTFEALCSTREADTAACEACGSTDVGQLLSAPHVGASHILADGSKRSEQDELRFRRLKVERQSWGLPWQKRKEHKAEMQALAQAANKAEGRGE